MMQRSPLTWSMPFCSSQSARSPAV
jgi:hypothetical protein